MPAARMVFGKGRGGGLRIGAPAEDGVLCGGLRCCKGEILGKGGTFGTVY